MIQTLLNAKVQIQQNDVGPRQTLVSDRRRGRLGFPEYGETGVVLQKHSQTCTNNRMVVDDGDPYCGGLRGGFLLSLWSESSCFHGARFIPVNVVHCKAQKVRGARSFS